MESIKEKLIKLAAQKKPSMTDQAHIERGLIHTAKHGDEYESGFAEIQLIKKYRNIIGQQAKKVGLSAVIDHNTACAYGTKIFRDSIHKYDPTKDIQPNTYFQNNLYNELRKERQRHVDFVAQKTEDLAQKNAHVMRAEGILRMQLGREPTNVEIYDYITNVEKKKIELKNIERIKDYERKEYSGDVQVGKDVGAEYMTKMDISNADRITPEQLYMEDLNEQEWIRIIKTFKLKKERRFLYNLLGLGEFKGNRAKNKSEAARNNNMTNYEADKVKNRFYLLATHKPEIGD